MLSYHQIALRYCHKMMTHHRKYYNFAVFMIAAAILFTTAPAVNAIRSRDKGRSRNNAASVSSNSPLISNIYGSSYAGATGLNGGYNGPMDTTGFCTRRRDMKLMCYCTPDENHVPVQKAECWIFSEGLLQNDTTWTRFYQQKRLRELKFVIQNNARLDYIPSMIIEPLKNLSSVIIEYSQVEVVKSYAFANLQYLERIILNNNHIMALDQDAFANHIRLRELNLEHNQIFEIDRYAFRNLPLCERLFLNNNNITNLHEGLFVDMARLTYLNLAYNQISVLTSEIFKGLGNLNVLKLTRNNLNFIGDTVFAELWSLMELELDDNRIERISERALDGLNNLKTLNLRNNLLKKIDNGLLRGTPALLSINVQSNELETLTFYTFQPIMDNLVNSTSELLLSDNNFICDCRLQWIYDLKNRTRHLQLRDSLEEFVCTLQEPKLSNFIEPVPNHILDLLNIGGYSSISSSSGLGAGNHNGNSNSLSVGLSDNNMDLDAHMVGLNAGRKHGSKSRTGVTRGQRQFAAEHIVELKKKRKRSPLPYKLELESASVDDIMESAALTASSSLASASTSASAAISSSSNSALMPAMTVAESDTLASLTQAKRYDYYDDIGAVNGMDDNLDLRSQKSTILYGAQQNDVLLHQQIGPSHNNNLEINNALVDTFTTKHGLGFKVRLFTLKPEMLPCHDELSDPTELPLSRDLMDVRSNVQESPSLAAVQLSLRDASLYSAIMCCILLSINMHLG